MPIQFACSCGVTLRVAENAAGKLVACPKCTTKLRVPVAEESTALQPGVPDRPALNENEPVSKAVYRVFHPGSRPEDADLFMPAPPGIGRLRSAHTSLSITTKHKPFWLRLVIGLALSLGIATVAAVGLIIGYSLPIDVGVFLLVAIVVVIALPILGLTLYFTRFRHYCAFVGERGFAHFTCSGRRDRAKVRGVGLFLNAEDLRVRTIQIYHNGCYLGTYYNFSWTDRSGKEAFAIGGKHRAHLKLPPQYDKYHFALAAEEAWSLYMLAKILPQLQAGKPYVFQLRGGDSVAFEKGFLELELKGKAQRFYPNDLAAVSVKQGQIALKEPGAKEGWFTSTGVHYFSFEDVANARVFLILLERMYGVRMTS